MISSKSSDAYTDVLFLPSETIAKLKNSNNYKASAFALYLSTSNRQKIKSFLDNDSSTLKIASSTRNDYFKSGLAIGDTGYVNNEYVFREVTIVFFNKYFDELDFQDDPNIYNFYICNSHHSIELEFMWLPKRYGSVRELIVHG